MFWWIFLFTQDALGATTKISLLPPLFLINYCVEQNVNFLTWLNLFDIHLQMSLQYQSKQVEETPRTTWHV